MEVATNKGGGGVWQQPQDGCPCVGDKGGEGQCECNSFFVIVFLTSFLTNAATILAMPIFAAAVSLLCVLVMMPEKEV